MNNLVQNINDAASYLHKKLENRPHIGLILGTGLGNLANDVNVELEVRYSEIPHFPQSTVAFHKGHFVFGKLANKDIALMHGRFHYYEGYSMQQISLPVRVMKALGVETLILTNAVGGLRAHLEPGTLLLVKDHINLMGDNPLIGPHDEVLGTRFPDMSEPYCSRLREIAHKVALDNHIKLHEGIYTAVSGPNFETAAEIRMLQTLGADTVGMSVVPEVIVARQLQIECLAINVITDLSLPDSMVKVTHQEVSRVANESSPKLGTLIKGILTRA